MVPLPMPDLDLTEGLALGFRVLGQDVDVDEVRDVVGTRGTPIWEMLLAAAQHYGYRVSLRVPSSITRVRRWTDSGFPVLVAWTPEEGSPRGALVVDVQGAPAKEELVLQAGPDEVVRIPVSEFMPYWGDRRGSYQLVRPACLISREITPSGKQVLASRQGKMRSWRRPYGKA